jgi:transposase InsO family protein
MQFADYVIEKLPFRVEQIQTDNGSEFQSAFHWHLLDRGLRHVYIGPSTPRLNGKVERSHRIDDEEHLHALTGRLSRRALSAGPRECETGTYVMHLPTLPMAVPALVA